MQYVADLHLHSKYSRAVSKDMVLPIMSQWAKKKGINILSTGDWTHPLWFREIQNQLEETKEGLFQLKSQINSNSQNPSDQNEPYFFLGVEISSIYSQGGKTRRIHNLIFSPSFETAEKINKELTRRGCNLMSDGRPIIGLSAKDLLELVLSIDKKAVLIPCHIWTPWFSLFGSNSGFDLLDDCFGQYSKYIFGIETGLSSDPLMNWQIKDLDKRTILSFSDSHSPAKMAREATVLELVKPTYTNVIRSLIHPSVLASMSGNGEKDEERLSNKIAFTIEFHPEEGKYHYNGHRNCGIVQAPSETRKSGVTCSVCKRPITVGVMQRVEDLSSQHDLKANVTYDQNGVKWFHDPANNHPSFVKLVPLLEIVAESLSSTVASMKVKDSYDRLCEVFGSELKVLMEAPIEKIASVIGEKVAEGVLKVRKNYMVIAPGFDGEYGKVKIWPASQGGNGDKKSEKQEMVSNKKSEKKQMGLF